MYRSLVPRYAQRQSTPYNQPFADTRHPFSKSNSNQEWLICDAAALNLTAPLPNRVDKDPESPFHNQFTLAQLEQAAALQQAAAAASTQQQQQQQEENKLPAGVTTPLAHQPCVNITMQPGSVLYMPRGTIHAPHTTADSHSFHATLGFPARQFAWFDTLLSVTRTLTALDLKRGGDKGMATQLADLVAYTGPDTNVGVAAVDSEGGTAVQEQGRLAQRPAGPLNSGTVGHLVKRTLQTAADRDWVLRARFPMWAVRGQPSASKPGAGNPLAEPRAGQGKRTWAFVRRQVRQLLSRLLLRATAANATQEEEAHGRALAEVVAEQLGVDASDASWSGVVEGAMEGLRAHLVNELELEVEAEEAEGGVRWKEVARARRAAAAAVRKKSGSPKKKKVKRRRERGSEGSSSSRRTPSTTGGRFDEGIAQAIDLLRLKRKTFKEVQQGVAANKFPQPKTKIDVGSHMRF